MNSLKCNIVWVFINTTTSTEEFPSGSWLTLAVPGWGKQLTQIALFVLLTDLILLAIVKGMVIAKCTVVSFHFLIFIHYGTFVSPLLKSHRWCLWQIE